MNSTCPSTGRDRGEPRPLTCNDASSVYERDLAAARKRYDELTGRDLNARSVARLRERGELDPADCVHAAWAASERLSAAERLEHMAVGEVLARYYRHPAMLDHAARAGASWEEIGAARGTSAGGARQDYREWADGQHHLYQDTGKWGLNDAQYAEALALAADPETSPPGGRGGG